MADKKVFYTILKTCFDFIAAVIMLVVLSPAFLVIAIRIKHDSPGPVIFSQERLGKDGKVFVLYKFRSMRTDAEKDGAQWAEADDPRTTAYGKRLRNHRIDEWPQLINVIRHEMSFVGPRPERKIFHDEFIKTIPEFDRRLEVLPGITGFAQISGGYDLTPSEKIIYDIAYIKNRSVSFDIKILFATVKVLMFGEGAR